VGVTSSLGVRSPQRTRDIRDRSASSSARCGVSSSCSRSSGSTRANSVRAVKFEHVLVVGAGQMGAGIAQVVAASGRRVSLHDAKPGATDRAVEVMRKSLDRLQEKGGPLAAEVLARVEAVADFVSADLMIEAVVENAETKEDIFRR